MGFKGGIKYRGVARLKGKMGGVVRLVLGGMENGFKFDKVSLTPSLPVQVFSRSTHTASQHVRLPFSSRRV